MEVTSPALRYHGAKFRLAPWIMQFFPPHTCYVEPFGGAAGVLLQKPRAYAEVYNDLDGDVVNYFAVLRDPILRGRLLQQLALTPYARDEFELAWTPAQEKVERARRLAVRAQMGFGSAGATKGITGFRIDTNRQYGTAQQLWAEYPEAVAAAGQRFTDVLIENRPAVDVMLAHDRADTLFFVDPPYVLGTRTPRASQGAGMYRHEMTDVDHEALLAVVLQLKGMVVLSGYASELYASTLGHWTKHTTSARISSGRGTGVRVECAWLNPACATALDQAMGSLFRTAA